TPLLLLDDVFEKLDEQRLQNFVAWLQQQQPVQVFITDTHAERLQAVLQQIDAQYQLIETK
ncbi:MAG: DNA replication and repair protein RecF, partial [Bacteroidetes bacterium]